MSPGTTTDVLFRRSRVSSTPDDAHPGSLSAATAATEASQGTNESSESGFAVRTGLWRVRGAGPSIHVMISRREFRALRKAKLGLGVREVFRCRAVVGTTARKAASGGSSGTISIIVSNAPRTMRWLPKY